MDPFVRRLIQRLLEPGQPLSRNRHFHTFNNPDGKRALRISRRLKALQKSIVACREHGGTTQLVRLEATDDSDGAARIEIRLESIKGHHVAYLGEDELELLAELPGVRDALEDARTLQAG
jgi:hypothetical protein